MTVGIDSPASSATRVTPPRPSARAAAPHTRRRCRSPRCGRTRSSIPATTPSSAESPSTRRTYRNHTEDSNLYRGDPLRAPEGRGPRRDRISGQHGRTNTSYVRGAASRCGLDCRAVASDSGGRAVPHRRRAFKAGAKLRLLAVVYAALLVAATLLPIRWEPGLVRYPGDDYRPQLVPLRGSGTDVFKSRH